VPVQVSTAEPIHIKIGANYIIPKLDSGFELSAVLPTNGSNLFLQDGYVKFNNSGCTWYIWDTNYHGSHTRLFYFTPYYPVGLAGFCIYDNMFLLQANATDHVMDRSSWMLSTSVEAPRPSIPQRLEWECRTTWRNSARAWFCFEGPQDLIKEYACKSPPA
jgi:hypothetical protein